jgi:hypothetical protein
MNKGGNEVTKKERMKKRMITDVLWNDIFGDLNPKHVCPQFTLLFMKSMRPLQL